MAEYTLLQMGGAEEGGAEEGGAEEGGAEEGGAPGPPGSRTHLHSAQRFPTYVAVSTAMDATSPISANEFATIAPTSCACAAPKR